MVVAVEVATVEIKSISHHSRELPHVFLLKRIVSSTCGHQSKHNDCEAAIFLVWGGGGCERLEKVLPRLSLFCPRLHERSGTSRVQNPFHCMSKKRQRMLNGQCPYTKMFQ